MARYTQADIDALAAVMASGARRVVYRNGSSTREQEFQSLEEMQAQMDRMVREVNGNTTTYRRVKFSKGFR